MEVSPEDLKLPQTVVTRLIKEALPAGATISKEAKIAIGRAAAIFVLHATSFANENSQAKKHKSILADDILYAVRVLECDQLEKPVQEALEIFKKQKAQKQQQKNKQKEVAQQEQDEPEGAGGDAEMDEAHQEDRESGDEEVEEEEEEQTEE